MSTRNDIPAPIETTADALRIANLLETHLRNMGLGAQADLAERLRHWITLQDHAEEMGKGHVYPVAMLGPHGGTHTGD